MSDDMKEWWRDLHDVWSKDAATFVVSGKGIDNSTTAFMGDFVFHRFFGTDDYDSKNVRTVLVEAKKWDKWNEWLEKKRNKKSLFVPRYVHPLETIIMSKKSFRVIKWVDEYRPYDFFPQY